MTSRVWLNVIAWMSWHSTTTSLPILCPLTSPTDGVVYVVDSPSSNVVGQTLSYCAMVCFFSVSLNRPSGDTCRCFNYNSTSMNCSLFNFDPLKTAIDSRNTTVAYQNVEFPVTGLWDVVPCSHCSVPFIYKGLIYNQPQQLNNDEYCDIYACVLADGSAAICTPSGGDILNSATNNAANSTLAVFGSPRPVLSINSWIIVQSKVPAGKSSTTFYQLWTSYRDGFGDLSTTSNYWIGNEVIYGLVSTGRYQLRVEVVNADSSSLSVIYTTFSIGSESIQYVLNVAGYVGVAGGDAISSTAQSNSGFVSNGMKFTTIDRDNDQWSGGNCADTRVRGGWSGGWWYRVCSSSVLNTDGLGNWMRIDTVETSRMSIAQM